MKIKHLILFSILFFISCEKNTLEINDYIGVYTQEETIDNNTTRLFTKAGEIKDQQLIADFIKRTEFPYRPNDYIESEIGNLQPLEIEIVNSSKAKIVENNKVTYRKIVKKDNYFYLESEDDTDGVLTRKNYMCYDIAMHHPIHYQVYDNKPLPPVNTEETDLREEWQTTAPEHGKPFFFKQCYYLKPGKEMLIMPMLKFRLKGMISPDISVKNWYKQNELKNADKAMKYLMVSDTLLIQESHILYKKKKS